MDCVFVSRQNSYIEILTLPVFAGGAFERWLGQEGGALQSSLSPSAVWEQGERKVV